MSILDQYEMRFPAGQNVIDLFGGEWSSEMPAQSGLQSTPGRVKLFEDPRVSWAETRFGGFDSRRVLELGPLEAGHTYMLNAGGAREIVAIEANTRAFLKCLCVKELLGLKNAKFSLGDFVGYMEKNKDPFDIVFASGVLYHMMDPIYVLDLIAKMANKVFLWTHYFDESILRANPDLTKKFSKLQDAAYNGYEYQYSLQSYDESLNWAGFCGGSAPNSRWLPRSVIIDFLKKRGFDDIHINFDAPAHVNGPSFAICAQRSA